VILPGEPLRRQVAEHTRAAIAAIREVIICGLCNPILPNNHTAGAELIAQNVVEAVAAGITGSAHRPAVVILRRRAVLPLVEAGNVNRGGAADRAFHPATSAS